MNSELTERVLDAVAAIAPGSVATYGDVAAAAGTPSPRLVGTILAGSTEAGVPWHRVLPASGRPAPHLAAAALARLAAEGVVAVDGRIPMRRYRRPPRLT